jgi:hypothetical protein
MCDGPIDIANKPTQDNRLDQNGIDTGGAVL